MLNKNISFWRSQQPNIIAMKDLNSEFGEALRTVRSSPMENNRLSGHFRHIWTRKAGFL